MFVFVSMIQAIGVVTIEAIFVAMILNLQKHQKITDVIAIENAHKDDKNDLCSAKFTMIVYLLIFMSSQAFQAVFSIQAVLCSHFKSDL